ncbi:MAG: histidinol-phosphate transaminase [Halieaceae bacterium]|nr:histidinol-phosphate transaminase [Halieaceae bacterium]
MSRRFWSDQVAGLEPYVPGEQPRGSGVLKLNTNESPYPPSPRVLEALSSISGEDLLRYPDPQATALREALADAHGLAPEQVFVGNGSDEVLAHVFFALFRRPGRLLFPDISYSFYPVWAQLYAIDYSRVPLREDFRIAVEDYDEAASSVILPNPNAPTGRLLALEEIRAFLDAGPDRLLVVDEAYIDYGGESAIALLGEYDNLLVIQTLSKSRALAGLRVGLAFGSAELIDALVRVKDSFNSYPVDVVAQRAALAAVRDPAWYDDCSRRVIRNREALRASLTELGFEVVPSSANFLFVRHPGHEGRALFAALRERGIIVRRWDLPRIDQYLRISVGTEEHIERVGAALAEIVSPGA